MDMQERHFYDPMACALSSLVLRRASGSGTDCLSDVAAALSHAMQAGHVCMDLSLPEASGWPRLSGKVWPKAEALRDLLLSTDWVSEACTSAVPACPYVLDEVGIYTQALFGRECRTAERLRQMALLIKSLSTAQSSALEKVFPQDGDASQRMAVQAILSRQFTVVAGGPGTGKTYTLSRALALLVADGLLPDRVALCAPTGRGAARFSESLNSQLPAVFAALEQPLPEQTWKVSTLHRLLGIGNQLARPRFHRGNPLPFDFVVVDESSMMDFVLFDLLIDALPSGAKLVLIGDQNQLSAVGAGNVLADIIAAMPQSCATLAVNHRSGNRIGALCEAVLAGKSSKQLLALQCEHFAWNTSVLSSGIIDTQLENYRPLAMAVSPQAALEQLDKFRILCAFNEGDFGLERIRLAAAGLFNQAKAVPVMVEENRPSLQLFNGDTGILWKDTGELWFPGRAEPLPSLWAGRVSEAWAMTIHRAQGSEYDAVCLLIGSEAVSARAQGILTRELLYTGLSRARRHIVLLGSFSQMDAAIARRVSRGSGLAERLRG